VVGSTTTSAPTAAALKTGAFADQVDFFSIGTNDLTQYALAAERGNPALADVSDPLDPGVLRLVSEVCRQASGRAAISVGGEMAADPAAAAVFALVAELISSPY
jgi:phosphoenolpyruvate-protein kinase (PTS system EI component)